MSPTQDTHCKVSGQEGMNSANTEYSSSHSPILYPQHWWPKLIEDNVPLWNGLNAASESFFVFNWFFETGFFYVAQGALNS
jgi:hypothetical protein